MQRTAWWKRHHLWFPCACPGLRFNSGLRVASPGSLVRRSRPSFSAACLHPWGSAKGEWWGCKTIARVMVELAKKTAEAPCRKKYLKTECWWHKERCWSSAPLASQMARLHLSNPNVICTLEESKPESCICITLPEPEWVEAASSCLHKPTWPQACLGWVALDSAKWTVPWNKAEMKEPGRNVKKRKEPKRTVKNLRNHLYSMKPKNLFRFTLVLWFSCATAQLYPSELLNEWSSWCHTWICSSLAFGTTSAKCGPKQLTHFRTSYSNKSV